MKELLVALNLNSKITIKWLLLFSFVCDFICDSILVLLSYIIV